jgi:hypothetical protein
MRERVDGVPEVVKLETGNICSRRRKVAGDRRLDLKSISAFRLVMNRSNMVTAMLCIGVFREGRVEYGL